MVGQNRGPLMRDIARLFEDGTVAGSSEGQQLLRFAVHGDEAAFEALVRLHGPMVLGVCRRLLRDRHDAEDAFQATFLVLARKAGHDPGPEGLDRLALRRGVQGRGPGAHRSTPVANVRATDFRECTGRGIPRRARAARALVGPRPGDLPALPNGSALPWCCCPSKAGPTRRLPSGSAARSVRCTVA